MNYTDMFLDVKLGDNFYLLRDAPTFYERDIYPCSVIELTKNRFTVRAKGEGLKGLTVTFDKLTGLPCIPKKNRSPYTYRLFLTRLEAQKISYRDLPDFITLKQQKDRLRLVVHD